MLTLLLQTAEPELEWPVAIIALGSIAMITAIVVVAIWQVLGTWRARMSVAREDAYRRLAEESQSTQSRLLDDHQRIAQDLATLKERITSIEKLLKEVG